MLNDIEPAHTIMNGFYRINHLARFLFLYYTSKVIREAVVKICFKGNAISFAFKYITSFRK